MIKEVTLTIEKLNEKGYGVGFIDEKEVWILNSLPGEEVRAEIFKRSKGISYGNAVEIIKKSNERLKPKEDHFLSCSPWQILDINYELQIKNDLIKSFYKEYADFDLPNFDIVFSGNEYGYRNKVEYSFYGDAITEEVNLAYHKRDGNRAKNIFKSCLLVNNKVSKATQKVVRFINENKIQARQLKGLLARYSYYEDKVVLALYIKDESLSFDEQEVKDLLDEDLKGLLFIYSDRKSPAFIESKLLASVGETDLVEKILDHTFYYPYDGFFQVNPPVFELALKDIIELIKNIVKKDSKVIDLYSGVGTIGLSVAPFLPKITGVELFEKSLVYAQKNIMFNKIKNFDFIQDKSEKLGVEVIKDADIVIVDPPRSGLHPKVVKGLIENKNISNIIYLSCNPKTQAQDFNQLKEEFSIKFIKAYNFYPHTPHVENLILLERM